MIQHIKNRLPTALSSQEMCTPEAVRELENAGADATKVGIGPYCITKSKPDRNRRRQLAVSVGVPRLPASLL